MSNETNQQEFSFTDQSSLHKYRTEIPNIIFDLGLDPYELALYTYFKKIAGDGGCCTQSKKTICKKLGICISVFKDRKKKLCMPRPELDNKSLINCTERFHENGDHDTSLITINDIWEDNFKIMIGRSPKNPGVGCQKTQGGSPKNPKEQLFEEDPINKHTEVVCLSSFQEVQEVLKKYKFNKKSLCSFMKYSKEHLEQAVLSAEIYMKSNKVKNVEGCVRNAIENHYTPKKDKESKEKEIKSTIKENKLEASKIINEYNKNPKNGLKFTIKQDRVEVLINKCYTNVGFCEINFIEKLKNYLK